MPETRRALRLSPARSGRRACLSAALAVSATVAIPSRAQAAPGLDGTRNLGMGGATRASSTGSGAMLANPANMGFTRQFLIDPVYQAQIENNTHGVGIQAMDSLMNPRVAVGLGYVATLGLPNVTFKDDRGGDHQLELFHMAHEVGLPIAINAAPGWLAFGVRPKFLQSSLRFVDAQGDPHDAKKQRLAFGLDLAMTVSIKQYVNVSVVGQNLVGPAPPATSLRLDPFVVAADSLSRSQVSLLSDFPRTLAHGLAVFPTRQNGFSINFDGLYDFTSFRHQDKYTRMIFAGGAEYTIKNAVPLRLGGYWDSRGRGKQDDRGFIACGIGFVRDAPKRGIGFDLGVGFSRQITGPDPETRLAVNLGIRINPQ